MNWMTFRRSSESNPRTPGTIVIIVLNILWFVLIEAPKGFSPTGIIDTGAIARSFVLAGQWFRVITAMFVHMSVLHLLVNMVSLWSLRITEMLLRTERFLVVYFLSGVAASLGALLFSPPFAVTAGASGAIFGIFGTALVFAFQGILGKSVRTQLLLLLVINLVYGFTHGDVSNIGHVSGLVIGIVITLVMTKVRWNRKHWRWFAGVFCILTLVAFAETFFFAN